MKRSLKFSLISVTLLLTAGAIALAVIDVEAWQSERRQVGRTIETLRLSAGQKVADIGANDGLFTFPVAEKIGSAGIVYAVEIEEKPLKKIEKKATARGLKNVVPTLGATDDPKLPEPVDLILIINTLHHITDRAAYLKTLRKYLKPGGRVAVIDFTDKWPWFHGTKKYSVTELAEWMKAAGFVQAEKHDFLDHQFFVIYQPAGQV